MRYRTKLEGSEIWEGIPAPRKKEAAAERAAALEAVQSEIIAHASGIRLTWEAEDDSDSATMAELMQALSLARTEELQGFLKSRSIPFEGGYIRAAW